MEKQVNLSAELSSRTKPLAVLKRKKKKTLLRDDFVLEDFYAAVRNNRLDSIHVPHSDVFFVKAAMEHHKQMKFKLADIEAAMRAEGWSESRVLKPKRYLYK
jgi:glycosylphosphatidylinositol transamidase (GPIT) subunit GPI8